MNSRKVPRLTDMTWSELAELDRDRTVFLLPVGAVEAHGPHLPLDTDVIIAQAMAREAGRILAQQEWEPMILPTVHLTCAAFAADFPGTLNIEPAAVKGTLESFVASLARHGFRNFAIANSHLDPQHLASLESAVHEVGRKFDIVVGFANLTRRSIAELLTEEFQSGACHAGQFETSIVMAERAGAVREEMRVNLPPVTASLSVAIKDGRRNFHEAGGPEAYFGSPAGASKEEGERTVEILGRIVAKAFTKAAEESGDE